MTQTRRDLLCGSGKMLAASTVLAAGSCAPTLAPSVVPGQDAELIRLCAEHIVCEQQIRAICDGPDAVDDDDQKSAVLTPIFARQRELVDQMEHLRATTFDGITARAQSLEQHNREWEFSFDARDTFTGRLLDYLLRDAAALGRV